MGLNWLPWAWIARRFARSFGLHDPDLFLMRVRRFGQPSPYDIPLEIVRNAILFHARGLINTRAIQNNLDWVWPYWIQRQFDPHDVSFLPRSANISHVNLTHRNWTAIGLPDLGVYPLVDPRGLITPLHDGWSIDAWLVTDDYPALIPSRSEQATQRLDTTDQSVTTEVHEGYFALRARAWVAIEQDAAFVRARYTARAHIPAHLIISVRPYNCEGIQFVDSIRTLSARAGWRINGVQNVLFSQRPDRVAHSTYADGDVLDRLFEETSESVDCAAGMATGAACFSLDGGERTVDISIPLAAEVVRAHGREWSRTRWSTVHSDLAQLRVPDRRFREIFSASVNTLIHLTARDVYPGPYTYRRFWFRDASLMLEALVQVGGAMRARRHLNEFVRRQRRDGFFESQQGEWDSNGEVLWSLGRYLELSGEALPEPWLRAITRATDWLSRARHAEDGTPQAGLLPAGFSAEHFGPNDHYYWDVFWAIGGLRTIAPSLARAGHAGASETCTTLAQAFLSSVERSIARYALKRGKGAIPASPFRRMDSGAIGVLVADYPLQIYSPTDVRIAATLDHLLKHHFVNGGFFQDMTHSGVNVYLTLAIAQSLLRRADTRWEPIVRQMQKDASPTGMWPEAIHPMTAGGCIGDGQHGWAAAEWVRWTRNAFVREEGDTLIFASGMFPEWLAAREPLRFGPTPTPSGTLTVELTPSAHRSWLLRIDAKWRTSQPKMVVAIPGTDARPFSGSEVVIDVEGAIA